mgnify:CR=1 FL=1
MITKMKKLTFLVYHKEYEAFLAQIRELGVVHVVERQCGEMDDTLQQFMQKRTLYKNMLQSMHTLADKQPEEKVHKELSADALVKFYEDLQARIQDLNQQIPAIDKDVVQMEVWGDFDWRAIRKLEDAGWFVQFYTCPEKDYNEAWAEDYNAIVVKENGGHLYFVTVTPQPVELDVEPLRLPSLSLSELRKKSRYGRCTCAGTCRIERILQSELLHVGEVQPTAPGRDRPAESQAEQRTYGRRCRSVDGRLDSRRLRGGCEETSR